MSQGLFTAVTGIKANQVALNVISNNIANLNTVAFKGSGVNFQTVFSQAISSGTPPTSTLGGTNPMEIGNGAVVSEIKQDFAQGGSLFTGRPTDMLIQGDGFFTVQNGSSSSDFYLTRAGNFSLDGKGNLVSSDGNQVLGTDTVSGDNPATDAAINLPYQLRIFKETDASNNVLQTWLGDSTTTTPSATLGGTVGYSDVQLTNYSAGTDGGITLVYSNGDQVTVRTDPTSSNTRELYQVTSDGSNFAPSDSGVTGKMTVLNDSVSGKAVIKPQQIQIRIGTVPNPSGLVSEGQNNFSVAPDSGSLSLGIGNSNGRGAISAGALESSNVDIAAEFTNMVIAQRGLEAAGKTITTQSSVMQTIINLIQ